MLWWLSVAPFGNPVVPLVYWMLIGSSGSSAAARAASPSASTGAPASSSQAGSPRKIAGHVAGLERRRGDQQAGPRLAQRVGELVRAVGRVDVDEDRPDPRRRVLHEHPLGAVGRPDADPLAALHAEPQQPGGQRVDARAELGIGPADALAGGDEGGPAAEAGDRPVEVGADRLAEQRDVVGAVGVRGGGQAPIISAPGGAVNLRCR
jgi:hypothetical protein